MKVSRITDDHGGRQGAQLNIEGCEDKATRFGVGESFSHTGEAEPVVPVSRPPCAGPAETGTECREEREPQVGHWTRCFGKTVLCLLAGRWVLKQLV